MCPHSTSSELHFLKVSFCEKTRQGRLCLMRDFPDSHIFCNAVDVLPAEKQQEFLSKTIGMHKAKELVSDVELLPWAPCASHETLCPVHSEPDLCFFGAPCVDDSSMGAKLLEEGNSRRAFWPTQEVCRVCVSRCLGPIPVQAQAVLHLGHVHPLEAFEAARQAQGGDIRKRGHRQHRPLHSRGAWRMLPLEGAVETRMRTSFC